MNWNSPAAVSTPPLTSSVLDPEEIRRLYWEEGLSLQAIADRFELWSKNVLDIMRQNNIPRRSRAEAMVLVSVERLNRLSEEVRRLYWEEGLSTHAVAKRLGVSYETIKRIMHRYSIPRRSHIEAQTLAEASGRWKGRKAILDSDKNVTHKFCPRCSELKPVQEFYRNNIRYDGLEVYCKKCTKERARINHLGTRTKHYFGLHKRPYPLDGRCEICCVELGKSCYHHFNDNNPSLGIWACPSCDYLAEGLDEISKNPWKVNIYCRLKEEVEKAEEVFSYFGPFSPPDGIYRLFLNGKQTHKWCPHCGEMKPVKEFNKGGSKGDGLGAWCRVCQQSDRLKCRLNGQNVVFTGLHKRPKPDCCELCNGKTHLFYHHWDNNNKSKGIWVCQTNKCHNLAEAVDKLDNGNLLLGKYYELKQKIILEDSNNTRITNLESRVTILEAENVLVEKQEVSKHGGKV